MSQNFDLVCILGNKADKTIKQNPSKNFYITKLNNWSLNKNIETAFLRKGLKIIM